MVDGLLIASKINLTGNTITTPNINLIGNTLSTTNNNPINIIPNMTSPKITSEQLYVNNICFDASNCMDISMFKKLKKLN